VHAASHAGYARRSLYDWRRADPAFAEEWADALELWAEALEAEADRRARIGVPQPVFYRGEVVGEITKFSDTLLIYLLQTAKRSRLSEPSSTKESALDDKVLTRIRHEVYGLPL
jgi:hypothetical protein